jgi:hypothetical protein
MTLPDHPRVTAMNASPALIARWGIVERDGRLYVPVTHRFPSALMGSGLGRDTMQRGDYDIQLADRALRRRHRLGRLRFGDMVAIVDGDTRFGPSVRGGRVTIGVVVHGDSVVSGHGPGVTPLLSAPAALLRPVHDAYANLAAIFNVRPLTAAREYLPLIEGGRTATLRGATSPARLRLDAPR